MTVLPLIHVEPIRVYFMTVTHEYTTIMLDKWDYNWDRDRRPPVPQSGCVILSVCIVFVYMLQYIEYITIHLLLHLLLLLLLHLYFTVV